MSTEAPEVPTDLRITDLYYAAYLKVAAVPFLGTEREGRRVFFIFERIPGLAQLRAQYFNRTPQKIAVLTLIDEIRAMKQMTHE
jgi:hypothetical protein